MSISTKSQVFPCPRPSADIQPHRNPRACPRTGPEYAIGDVIDWTYSGNKLHPTQKPLPVLLPLVDTFSPKQGVVLDPFAGSGSTLQAAQMLGRSYIGIELDAKYHAIAEQRLAPPKTA
jgi:DNA modification methylase